MDRWKVYTGLCHFRGYSYSLSSVLKAVKQVDQLSLVPLENRPVYATTLEKCTTDSNGITVYQGQELKSFSSSKTYYEAHYSDYCEQITEYIKNRLAWSSLQVLRDIILFLLPKVGIKPLLSTINWKLLTD